MNAVISFFMDRALTTLCLFFILIIAGASAYMNIPKEAEPDLQLPLVQVGLVLDGVSPVDAERLLVRPAEEQLNDLDGLKGISATASEGRATLILEYGPGADLDKAVQDVRDKIDRARAEMPADIEEPQISEIDLSWFPVVLVAMTGDAQERVMSKYARAYRDRVSTLPGVLDVEITGIREEVVEVTIDPVRAQSYRLNSDDLARVFNSENRLVAAGKLDTGQGAFSVSVPGLFETVDDILGLPIKTNGNAVVTVGDVAKIRRTFKDPTSLVRVDGKPAIAIEVNKRAGANLLETSKQARAMLAEMSTTWPASVRAQVIQDQSLQIGERILSLQNSVLLAVFLVMAVVVAALGVRSGLLVGLAIPGAFLGGILMISTLGLTINVVVMFGLIIAVGILVDGAIVVTEYADRKMVEGLERREAYLLAARRMSWPIISSTGTTVAAFFPLLFWPGLTGQLMGFLPITLICILIGSLVMALIFVPTLGGLIGAPDKSRASLTDSIGQAVQPDRLTLIYGRFLQWALARPGKIVAGTFTGLLASVGLYAVAGNGIAFFPAEEPERLTLLVQARGNLSVDEQGGLIRQVEDRIIGLDGVRTIYARTGVRGGDSAPDVIGQVSLELMNWEDRRSSQEIIADARQRIKNIPGINAEVQARHTGPSDGKPIDIELTAVSMSKLSDAVDHVRKGIETIGGTRDLEDSRPLPGIEWRLDVDRSQAARYGADLSTIGNAVRLVTNGARLGKYRPDDSETEIDILVRYPEEFRSATQLDELMVQTQNGLVPISNFVERTALPQSTEIKREDGRRVLSVAANVADGVLPNQKVAELKTWLAENPVDGDVTLTFEGQQADEEESGNFLGWAFGVALLLMAIILLLQFNSLYSVALILSSVILSTIGVLLGHLITGLPFSIVMSGIGVIALAGIIVNNNIVLIDTYERLLKQYGDVREAVMQTGLQRLRPVLLTTGTTALGLFPMACMVSIDFFGRTVSVGAPANLWWGTLAMTIVSGLSFATILTLVFTPCALMLKRRKIVKAGVLGLGASEDVQDTVQPVPALTEVLATPADELAPEDGLTRKTA